MKLKHILGPKYKGKITIRAVVIYKAEKKLKFRILIKYIYKILTIIFISIYIAIQQQIKFK